MFGKEIILQVLAQRNCEGIRYILGKDSGKNTIVLIGVEDAGVIKDSQGNDVAQSKPLQLPLQQLKDLLHWMLKFTNIALPLLKQEHF